MDVVKLMVKRFIERDLKTKCWWCGNQCAGFSKELGRNLNPYHEHFCNKNCENMFNECKKIVDKM